MLEKRDYRSLLSHLGDISNREKIVAEIVMAEIRKKYSDDPVMEKDSLASLPFERGYFGLPHVLESSGSGYRYERQLMDFIEIFFKSFHGGVYDFTEGSEDDIFVKKHRLWERGFNEASQQTIEQPRYGPHVSVKSVFARRLSDLSQELRDKIWDDLREFIPHFTGEEFDFDSPFYGDALSPEEPDCRIG